MRPEDAASGHALLSLRLLLEAYASSELPEWELFAGNVLPLYTPPGSVLFNAGSAHPYVYFVHRGCLKAQMTEPSGRESTVFFVEEGDILASMPALGSEGVRRVAARGLHPRSGELQAAIDALAQHTVIAIEPSLVQRVDFRVIEHLSEQHLQWAQLVTSIALMQATSLQADAVWLRGSAEQRYRELAERNPGLVRRVTQRDLASYLNVTEASLSRIVRRIRDGASCENSA